MAKRYKIGSQQGLDFYNQRFVEPKPHAIGDEVELALDSEEQEQALLEAGWLKPAGKPRADRSA